MKSICQQLAPHSLSPPSKALKVYPCVYSGRDKLLATARSTAALTPDPYSHAGSGKFMEENFKTLDIHGHKMRALSAGINDAVKVRDLF